MMTMRSMITTIMQADMVVPRRFLVRKYNGTPTAAASEKQISCLLVRLNMTLFFTLVRSLGTCTYAIASLPSRLAITPGDLKSHF